MGRRLGDDDDKSILMLTKKQWTYSSLHKTLCVCMWTCERMSQFLLFAGKSKYTTARTRTTLPPTLNSINAAATRILLSVVINSQSCPFFGSLKKEVKRGIHEQEPSSLLFSIPRSPPPVPPSSPTATRPSDKNFNIPCRRMLGFMFHVEAGCQRQAQHACRRKMKRQR